jgi:predicted DNA-binding protein YlxM (UPF0122 family)
MRFDTKIIKIGLVEPMLLLFRGHQTYCYLTHQLMDDLFLINIYFHEAFSRSDFHGKVLNVKTCIYYLYNYEKYLKIIRGSSKIAKKVSPKCRNTTTTREFYLSVQVVPVWPDKRVFAFPNSLTDTFGGLIKIVLISRIVVVYFL